MTNNIFIPGSRGFYRTRILILIAFMALSHQAWSQWQYEYINNSTGNPSALPTSGTTTFISNQNGSTIYDIMIGLDTKPKHTDFVVSGVSVFTSGDVSSLFSSHASANAIEHNTVWLDGKALIDKVHVETGTFPDYVFQSGYPLLSLTRIKQYYTEKGHLPGVPSEAEVTEAGSFELDKLSLILLEKIEELTLHTLSMDEEIKQAMQELERLKDKDQ